MKFVTVKQGTDLQALGATLLKASAGANAAATLGRIEALNPHLDLQRLAVGDVLLLPDTPDLDPGQTQSVGGSAFQGFSDEILRGLDRLTQRARAQTETLAANRAVVNGVLKMASVKRVIETDPQLSKQLAEVDAQSRVDQNAAQAAAKQVDALHQLAAAELDALGRLLK
jgi:hypothetical protein